MFIVIFFWFSAFYYSRMVQTSDVAFSLRLPFFKSIKITQIKVSNWIFSEDVSNKNMPSTKKTNCVGLPWNIWTSDDEKDVLEINIVESSITISGQAFSFETGHFWPVL